MALPDTRPPGEEAAGRDLKTRQGDLAKMLPALFSNHPQEWVTTAWGVHTAHQTYVKQGLSTVFAAETSSELKRAISRQLTQFRAPEASAFAKKFNKDRIFARVVADEERLETKLEDYDTGKPKTQGEKLLYDSTIGKGPYPADHTMEVALGRRNVRRLIKIWEDADKGTIDDLQRMKFAAALSIAQLGLLLPGQSATAKQTLKTELSHINLLVRAGATTLEPSLATPRKKDPEPDAAGEPSSQAQPASSRSPYDDLIASVETVFVDKSALAANANRGRTAAGASRSEVVLAELANAKTDAAS